MENRVYAVDGNFPRIVSDAFVVGTLPPGITRITYWIDLTNEPPIPLSSEAMASLLQAMATAI